MDKIKWIKVLLLLLCAHTSLISCQSYPPNTTPLTGTNAVSSPVTLYTSSFLQCNDGSNQNNRFPVGLTMEGLISLIERLEDNLANTTDNNLNKIKGAEQVARLILKRFRLDGYDETLEKQDQRDQVISQITDAFVNDNTAVWDNSYYFPDYIYTQQELCSLMFSFSHSIANISSVRRLSAPVFRGKRQAVVRSSVYRQSQSYNNFQEPVGSPYLAQSSSINSTRYPIREEGVVSFRGNKFEAIAPARVLIGVIAGLYQNIKTQMREILVPIQQYNPTVWDKPIDPVIAITLADLWGSGVVPTNLPKTYQYGLSGEWHSTSCTTHYSLTSVPETDFRTAFTTSKGTKAEIRGGLDGYIIATALKAIQLTDASRLRLSTILRTYYAKPKQTASNTNAFSVTYCDRPSRSQISALQDNAILYNAIYQFKTSSIPSQSLIPEFTNALSTASQVETQGLSEYCTQRPSGVLDKTAPCETPSDILYIIDGANVNNLRISADVVTTVNGNSLLTRRGGGTVSVFINNQGRNAVNNNIQLPTGPGDWPLVCAAFNTSNPGFASCRIEDFNATTLTPVQNLGKYFYFLNQTLFNYKYWTPRANFTGVPGKSVVLIDLSNMPQPDSNQDRNDYNHYKDQLRYRHRDVRYLGASQSTDTFKDLLRDQNDRDTPGSAGSPNYQLGTNFAARVCDNPAVFQWPDCYRRRSDNAQFVGYVTPGYKQNWAMYPEYFLKSFDINYKFKAELGSIRVCYDRYFPPERQDDNHCKDINANEEKAFPTISNPCKGQSFESCQPFYFTVWGKESQTQCLDDACSSLDQIKWTATHSGVQCSSSHHLLPSFTFQIIVACFASIFYLFFANNKS